MRKLFFLIYCGFAFQLHAQSPRDVYSKSLQEVFDKIENEFGVKLIYEQKVVDKRSVEYADWKFFTDIESTLANILMPLELRYIVKANNQFEIKSWEYFRKPYTEGDKHLQKLLDQFDTLEKWETRKKDIKTNMLSKMGLAPFPRKNDLNPIRSNFRKHDGYNAENIALEVLPGVYLSGTLYSPGKPAKKNPAMLSPHGHFYNNIDKSIPNERGRYREDQQKRCAMLAKMGVYVFSYDMFAWGESNYQVPLKDHRSGLALTMQTWNAMRVVDFLLSMKEIDPERIGVTGASGGGTQTFIAAALDERITLSVPTVMVSAHFFGGCPCESGLPIHQLENGIQTNNAEISAIFAPKPQLVISDGNDWTQTVPQSEYLYLQKIYTFYNATDKIRNAHFQQEGHDYGISKRIAMYEFVSAQFQLNTKLVKNKVGNWDESKIVIEPATALYVFGEKNPFPAHAVMGLEGVRRVLYER